MTEQSSHPGIPAVKPPEGEQARINFDALTPFELLCIGSSFEYKGKVYTTASFIDDNKEGNVYVNADFFCPVGLLKEKDPMTIEQVLEERRKFPMQGGFTAFAIFTDEFWELYNGGFEPEFKLPEIKLAEDKTDYGQTDEYLVFKLRNKDKNKVPAADDYARLKVKEEYEWLFKQEPVPEGLKINISTVAAHGDRANMV